MNAKEKAQELVSKYITSQDKWYLENLVDGIRISQAKQCAKIAVEEIIKEIKSIEFNHDIDIQCVIDYYDEVLKGIDLL